MQESPAEYGGYVFEPWAVTVGWLLTVLTVLPIPVYAIWRTVSYKREFGRAVSSPLLSSGLRVEGIVVVDVRRRGGTA